MSYYPEGHHPVFFLISALRELGADVEFVKNDSTLNCWGAKINDKLFVYLIDNRLLGERVKEDPAAIELQKRGVLVCHAQKQDMERVGGKWLPLAATPGYRTPPKPVEKLYDVCFVGYVRDHGRQAVLAHVARHYKLCVMQGVFGDEAVSLYWQSKVALNVPTNYGALDAYDSANMRLFEAMATGTPVCTSYEPYLKELGIEDRKPEVVLYTSPDYIIDGIAKRLEHPEALTTAGLNNAKLVQDRHTYAHRAKQVLEWLK